MARLSHAVGRVARGAGILVLCGVACVICAGSSFGQAADDEIVRMVTEARKSGAIPTDEEAQRFIETLRNQAQRDKEIRSELDWNVSAAYGSEAPPLSHVEGKDGIAFPTESEAIWPPPPSPTPTPKVSLSAEQVVFEKPYQRPPRCEKNETKREVFEKGEEESMLMLDLLFIDESKIPPEPEETLGSQVRLLPYGGETDEVTVMRMEMYQVPCVPFRRRMTNTTMYYDTGLNALRNYDGDWSGHGKMHPLMQEKLFPTKKPAPRRPTAARRPR